MQREQPTVSQSPLLGVGLLRPFLEVAPDLLHGNLVGSVICHVNSRSALFGLLLAQDSFIQEVELKHRLLALADGQGSIGFGKHSDVNPHVPLLRLRQVADTKAASSEFCRQVVQTAASFLLGGDVLQHPADFVAIDSPVTKNILGRRRTLYNLGLEQVADVQVQIVHLAAVAHDAGEVAQLGLDVIPTLPYETRRGLLQKVVTVCHGL